MFQWKCFSIGEEFDRFLQSTFPQWNERLITPGFSFDDKKLHCIRGFPGTHGTLVGNGNIQAREYYTEIIDTHSALWEANLWIGATTITQVIVTIRRWKRDEQKHLRAIGWWYSVVFPFYLRVQKFLDASDELRFSSFCSSHFFNRDFEVQKK